MYSQTTFCDVGYCLADPSGGFAFQPPRTIFSERDKPLGMRAIQNCPAVNSLERQVVEMPSPIGIRLVLNETDQGPELEVIPTGTFVQPEMISRMVSMEPPERWRHPKMPVVQITLPFFLVTDTACMVSQLPPFFSPAMRRWPGTMVAGRFPLAIWPQDLVWSFEWDRPGDELTLKQGEPLCYFLFEFNHPEKRPRLVEAALTPELDEYRRGIDGLHYLTPEIEEIWESAGKRRPERLLVPLAEVEAANA